MLSEVLQTVLELNLDVLAGFQQALSRGHVVGLRKDRQSWHATSYLPCQRIEIRQRLDLVVEQFDPHGVAIGLRRKDVDYITTDPVGTL